MHTLIPAFILSGVLALALSVLLRAYHGGQVCKLIGHDWVPEAPWTGKELTRERPDCRRCGSEPRDIRIIGSAKTNKEEA